MTRHLELRTGVYHDSVTLMQVSRTVGTEPGVKSALVAMATELNLALLANLGFDAPGNTGPNDLLVAIDTTDDDALDRALATVESALSHRTTSTAAGFGATPAPRTVGVAARSAGTVAFISTPGPYAFTDAMDALEHNLPVIVFSDNVPLDQEIRLKHEARLRELLVMGPDCGTAMIGGVGFGFANVVQPGPVGLVAASGTGAQHLMCLLSGAGVGISHCLGVGGRDLTTTVAAASTLTALDMLAADAATELIVVVSKPPAPEVAERVQAYAASLSTPVLFAFLGEGQPDLSAAARSVVERLGRPWAEPRTWNPSAARPEPPQRPKSGQPQPASGQPQPRSAHPQLASGQPQPGSAHPQPESGKTRSPATPAHAAHYLRGLFAGGTLCDEAMVIASAELGEVRSNIPLRPEWELGADLRATGHVMIDFGDDALTQGRAHPMIDGSLRAERMLTEAADPSCGVLLLDVVLGHGAHPDPAAELAPAIVAAQKRAADDGRAVAVVVSLTGTDEDPQDLDRQARALAGAGASVHLSNAAAAREAVRRAGGTR